MRPDKRNSRDYASQSLLMTAPKEPIKSQDYPCWQLSAFGVVFKEDWMHYYQFHIGDYASHTSHLNENEDLAYRRMLDYCYLNEIGLPPTVEEIARLIRMRTHCESIANVLREFFVLHDDGVYRQFRVEQQIADFRGKSDKAKKAARKRWENTDANALPTHSERNANHKPITNNHNKKKNRAFAPPLVDDITAYLNEIGNTNITPSQFLDYYQAQGWKLSNGRPMVDWKAAVRTWIRRESKNGNSKNNTWKPSNKGRCTTADEIRIARENARNRHSARSPDLGSVVETR